MAISLVVVGASAVASMIIGNIWYGPLFGKTFMQAMGMDTWTPEQLAAEKKKMGKIYAIQLVASLVMFYVLAMFIEQTGEVTMGRGITTALWVWFGFVAPVQLGSAIWGGSMTMFWLGAGNMLATLLAAGAIIGAWSCFFRNFGRHLAIVVVFPAVRLRSP